MTAEQGMPNVANLVNTAGIVTVNNWMLAPNGGKYLHFWCKEWVIVPDKNMPVEGFHSAEKWSLFARVGDRSVMAIPGCRVAGWSACDAPPPDIGDCYACGR